MKVSDEDLVELGLPVPRRRDVADPPPVAPAPTVDMSGVENAMAQIAQGQHLTQVTTAALLRAIKDAISDIPRPTEKAEITGLRMIRTDGVLDRIEFIREPTSGR